MMVFLANLFSYKGEAGFTKYLLQILLRLIACELDIALALPESPITLLLSAPCKQNKVGVVVELTAPPVAPPDAQYATHAFNLKQYPNEIEQLPPLL